MKQTPLLSEFPLDQGLKGSEIQSVCWNDGNIIRNSSAVVLNGNNQNPSAAGDRERAAGGTARNDDTESEDEELPERRPLPKSIQSKGGVNFFKSAAPFRKPDLI